MHLRIICVLRHSHRDNSIAHIFDSSELFLKQSNIHDEENSSSLVELEPTTFPLYTGTVEELFLKQSMLYVRYNPSR